MTGEIRTERSLRSAPLHTRRPATLASCDGRRAHAGQGVSRIRYPEVVTTIFPTWSPPRAVASWTAYAPTPPVAPETRTVSPGPTASESMRSRAVTPASPTAAACSELTPGGTCVALLAPTVNHSAIGPPPSPCGLRPAT